MKNLLVAYFSAGGVTRGVAEKLAAAAQAELHEIRPAALYTAADLDYTKKTSRCTLEMQDLNSQAGDSLLHLRRRRLQQPRPAGTADSRSGGPQGPLERRHRGRADRLAVRAVPVDKNPSRSSHL